MLKTSSCIFLLTVGHGQQDLVTSQGTFDLLISHNTFRSGTEFGTVQFRRKSRFSQAFVCSLSVTVSKNESQAKGRSTHPYNSFKPGTGTLAR